MREDGKTIRIGRLRRRVTALMVALAIMLAGSINLFALYKDTRGKKKNLLATLKASQQNVAALKKEVESLKLRLVLAESKSKASGAQGKQSEKIAKDSSLMENVESTQAQEKPEAVQLEKQPPVAIEDFVVIRNSDRDSIEVEFVIKKIDSKIHRVKGYAFVIIKHNEKEQNRWLTLPSVRLVSGKPYSPKKGQSFSIAHFKPMKFKKISSGEFEHFTKATVFVFGENGKPMLEKDFPIYDRQKKKDSKTPQLNVLALYNPL